VNGGTSTRSHVCHNLGAVINRSKGNSIMVIRTKPSSMSYANVTMNLI
jgi:hypothetical protein